MIKPGKINCDFKGPRCTVTAITVVRRKGPALDRTEPMCLLCLEDCMRKLRPFDAAGSWVQPELTEVTEFPLSSLAKMQIAITGDKRGSQPAFDSLIQIGRVGGQSKPAEPSK